MIRVAIRVLCMVAALGFSAGAAGQVTSIATGGSANVPAWNWPAGTYQVKAVLLDATLSPIGGLSTGFSFGATGSVHPSLVTYTLVSAPVTSSTIRFYRTTNATLNPGDTNVAFADFVCTSTPCAAGSNPLATASNTLQNPAFTGTGTVLPVTLQGFHAE